MEPSVTEEDQRLPWRGVHHIALVTPDLDETVRFYRDVLGMSVGQVSVQTARNTGQRHLFINLGGTDGWGLHVFENTSAVRKTVPLGQQLAMMETGVQHLAFALPDEAAAAVLRTRLGEHGVEMTAVRTLGPIRNTLFLDNNGILLEATWLAP